MSDSCPRPPSEYTKHERLQAMLVVRELASAWRLPAAKDDTPAVVPSASEVAHALDLLRCDVGQRAQSRYRRALAIMLAYDWTGEHSIPRIIRLGLADVAAVEALKKAIVDDMSDEAFRLFGADREWREYAILRHLTGPAGRLEAGPLTASTGTSCWRPESKSTYQFVNPYVEMTAHVSVDRPLKDVRADIDAQRWDVCGDLWSPPSPSDPDGAKFVDETWASDCTTPSGPFTASTSPPKPGTVYPKQWLYERFYCPGAACNAAFQNLLRVFTFKTTEQAQNGQQVSARQLHYRLPTCGLDKFEGALGGSIGSSRVTTVLDSGWIRVWEENNRVHVRANKRAQFSSPSANWLTQLNPALQELNGQLGELACCM